MYVCLYCYLNICIKFLLLQLEHWLGLNFVSITHPQYLAQFGLCSHSQGRLVTLTFSMVGAEFIHVISMCDLFKDHLYLHL